MAQGCRIFAVAAIERPDGETRRSADRHGSRSARKSRMRDYFDADLSWDEYESGRPLLTEDAAAIHAKDARTKAMRPNRLTRTRAPVRLTAI